MRYICSIPVVPTIKAPVGKSGPRTFSSSASSSSSRDALGLRSAHCTPSATSPRLCGGMLVAIPTAIPAEPLTSRLGNRLGSSSGSEPRPS